MYWRISQMLHGLDQEAMALFLGQARNAKQSQWVGSTFWAGQMLGVDGRKGRDIDGVHQLRHACFWKRRQGLPDIVRADNRLVHAPQQSPHDRVPLLLPFRLVDDAVHRGHARGTFAGQGWQAQQV